MTLDNEFAIVASAIVAALAVARVVRLVVDDDYPPMLRLKGWYVHRVSVEWVPLAECPFCVAPYVSLPAALWYASLWAWPHWTVNNWIWWIVNGWAALAYVAAMIVVRDLPKESRE